MIWVNRHNKKTVLVIDETKGIIKVVDGYKKIIESDVKTVLRKLGLL